MSFAPFLKYYTALIMLVFLTVELQGILSNSENSNNQTAKPKDPCLYHWPSTPQRPNFGDELSHALVERIIKKCIEDCNQKPKNQNFSKFLAIGSVIHFASDGDTIWGSGVRTTSDPFKFKNLDVRAVRGPLSRQFLMEKFNITVPEIYGDPALLFPQLFPEFKKAHNPAYDYIVIPHMSEEHMFPLELSTANSKIVYPTNHWANVVAAILNSNFVLSSSLHGIIIAEAYGIPARQLRVSNNAPIFKYQDYYASTNRPNSQYATSITEALKMGGEKPLSIDLNKLYAAFPFDLFQ